MAKKIKVPSGCLLIVIVLVIFLASGALWTVGNINSRAYDEVLKSLGFASREEFSEFSQKLKAEYDESALLINAPTQNDLNSSISKVKTSVILNNGDSIFDEQNKFKLDEINDIGVVVNNNIEFSDKEFCAILNLLIESLDINLDVAQEIQLRQIDYIFVSQEKSHFNFFVEIDISSLQKKVSRFGDFIPAKLLFNIGFDLKSNGLYNYSECSLSVNALDQKSNNQFIIMLSKILNKTEKETLEMNAKFIVDLISGVFSTMNCNLLYKSDIIELSTT